MLYVFFSKYTCVGGITCTHTVMADVKEQAEAAKLFAGADQKFLHFYALDWWASQDFHFTWRNGSNYNPNADPWMKKHASPEVSKLMGLEGSSKRYFPYYMVNNPAILYRTVKLFLLHPEKVEVKRSAYDPVTGILLRYLLCEPSKLDDRLHILHHVIRYLFPGKVNESLIANIGAFIQKIKHADSEPVKKLSEFLANLSNAGKTVSLPASYSYWVQQAGHNKNTPKGVTTPPTRTVPVRPTSTQVIKPPIPQVTLTLPVVRSKTIADNELKDLIAKQTEMIGLVLLDNGNYYGFIKSDSGSLSVYKLIMATDIQDFQSFARKVKDYDSINEMCEQLKNKQGRMAGRMVSICKEFGAAVDGIPFSKMSQMEPGARLSYAANFVKFLQAEKLDKTWLTTQLSSPLPQLFDAPLLTGASYSGLGIQLESKDSVHA